MNNRPLNFLLDREFNEVLNLACIVGDVHIAYIHFFDHDRSWKIANEFVVTESLKFPEGLEQLVRYSNLTTTIIPNIALNSDYAEHPLVVSEKGIQFIAAFPLNSADGETLGLLHILGTEPKILSPEQIHGLTSIARLASEKWDLEPFVRQAC